MLSQVLPLPLQLQIPRYMGDYASHISPLDRPKPSASPSYHTGISAVASARLSPVQPDSPRDNPDKAHRLPSPASPQENSTTFEIVGRTTGSFDSNICQADIYNSSDSPSYSSQPYSSVSGAPSSVFLINNDSRLKSSDTVVHYLSDSPSPIDVQQPPSLSHPSSAPPSQDRFPHSSHPLYPGPDRTLVHSNPNLERSPLEEADKYPMLHSANTPLDQRRMSEPALLTANHFYHHHATDPGSASRQQSFSYDYSKSPSSMYLAPALHRGASTGSLRDLRQQHYQYPPSNGGWKHDHTADRQYEQVSPLDEPLSPFQPNFSGGLGSPTGVQYSANDNFYGPSPPGTGTSTSSSGPLSAGLPGSLPQLHPFRSPQRSLGGQSHSPAENADRKNYSFIALPGNAVKKRPRRRYDEIERLYQCSWPDCAKAYGTLNHLNAHVTMQKHGSKRSPNEFKELRKQWRKAKKEADGHDSLRRSNFGVSRDYDYDTARFAYSNSPQRSHLLEFPPSTQVAQTFNHGQYSEGTEETRYAHQSLYGGSSRSQHSDDLSTSWPATSALLPRNVPPTSFSHLDQPAHLPHFLVTESTQPPSVPMPPSPSRLVNRLPPDSTLLTPLPAYLSQPLSIPGVDHVVYASDNYDHCDNDNSRPGTGYTSASAGVSSGDEYDHRL